MPVAGRIDSCRQWAESLLKEIDALYADIAYGTDALDSTLAVAILDRAKECQGLIRAYDMCVEDYQRQAWNTYTNLWYLCMSGIIELNAAATTNPANVLQQDRKQLLLDMGMLLSSKSITSRSPLRG